VESLRLQNNSKPHAHLVCDSSAPDSGYASAEEDDDDTSSDFDGRNEALELLRNGRVRACFRYKVADRLHCAVRCMDFFSTGNGNREHTHAQSTRLSLYWRCSRARNLSKQLPENFPSWCSGAQPVEVELNDAPLVSEDHTSVGLQSWASSILLAERLCANPGKFSLDLTTRGRGLRLLELGAGTGLLSITVAKILASGQVRTPGLPPIIVATDFHPDVLANLQRNVDDNAEHKASSCENSIGRSRTRVACHLTALLTLSSQPTSFTSHLMHRG
jgi:hypothetical protein